MTIQFVDLPQPVCQWYAEQADELNVPALELMAQVLTLWPETGKPVKSQPEPRERTLEDQVASLGNVLGAALARIAILESAQSPKGAVVEAQDFPFGGTF